MSTSQLRQAASNGKLAAVQKLLVDNDVNAVSEYGDTALYAAAANGHTTVVMALLTAGADPNIRAQNSDTALRAAVYGNHTAVALALLDAGADPSHLQPLHKATQHGNVEVVTALLAKGAKRGVPSRQGYTEADYLKQVKGPNHAKLEVLFAALPSPAKTK